jgi:hypothetical protein
MSTELKEKADDLNGLFYQDRRVRVTPDSWNSSRTWTVTLAGLSESEVSALADKVAEGLR